jgi:hypothetical protein
MKLDDKFKYYFNKLLIFLKEAYCLLYSENLGIQVIKTNENQSLSSKNTKTIIV